MLPLSVFTLALLGGFIFVSRWHWTRYHALRSDGYRLVLTSAIFGAFFLFVATTLSSLALMHPWGHDLSDFWHRFVPPKHSGKATIAFLLGALSWKPLNWLGQFRWLRFLSDTASIDRELVRQRNPLEVLLRYAMKYNYLVSVTVSNGKVYIGRVSTTFNPAIGMQAVNLVLSRSGHRDKDTQQMKLDVNYDETHATIRNELEKKLIEELTRTIRENPNTSSREVWDSASRKVDREEATRNYEIVIPIEEVQSVNIFNMDIYDKYFAPKRSARKATRRK